MYVCMDKSRQNMQLFSMHICTGICTFCACVRACMCVCACTYVYVCVRVCMYTVCVRVCTVCDNITLSYRFVSFSYIGQIRI